MKALVLAAGQSTRLRPLTDSLPKALLLVGGKAILDHQIEALIAAGITELILVVGFEKEKIIKHLSEQNYPIAITYIHNDEYRTTGPIVGGLLPAAGHLEGPLIFFHCDVLFNKEALLELLAHPAESVMLVRENHWDEEAGKVRVDAQGQVRELGKHISKEHVMGEYL
ncbi:MAG TPA: sugar phosphate nucleotidyltransferase [Candidatus Paceibacterota bacterium]|jgi:NDP-sugar pyrophosphorylase family protein|nr:sugar phosphate nucleotidyltransferase [Candidatus Paceibacterota bacterium]